MLMPAGAERTHRDERLLLRAAAYVLGTVDGPLSALRVFQVTLGPMPPLNGD